MNLRPLHDQAVVKRAKPDEKSEGGIILPNAEGRISIFADVIAVGPKSSVAPGDRVVLDGWKGKAVRIDGQDFIAVRDEDIVGVMQ